MSLVSSCRFLFSAMIQKALLAPMVWILITLLDGKIFVCAFSMSVDPALFSGIYNTSNPVSVHCFFYSDEMFLWCSVDVFPQVYPATRVWMSSRSWPKCPAKKMLFSETALSVNQFPAMFAVTHR